MKASIIVTVKNEGDGLRPLLDSLINQTYFADEVVICDGGSSDNTLEILEEYKQHLPLKIVVAPGSNISIMFCDKRGAEHAGIIAVSNSGRIRKQAPGNMPGANCP